MKRSNLSNRPKSVPVKDNKAAAWYYEEPAGLELIVEVAKQTSDGGVYNDFIHVVIPWRAVLASVNRYKK
jgi:hypothetical protein